MNTRTETARPPAAAETLELLRAEMDAHFGGAGDHRQDLPTAIPYLSFIRFNAATTLNKGMLEPSVCLVVQGRKKILIGPDITQYSAGSYVLSAVDMPVAGQVVEASPATPYLGLRIALDPKEIAALIVDMEIPAPPATGMRSGACVDAAGPELQDAFLRLVKLLRRPADIPVLSRLLKQEILYRLLTAESGATLYQVLEHRHRDGINRAIQWIRANYAKPMRTAALARAAGMSISSLHRHFKAVTVMSPLQYQKQIRLLEARQLLLSGRVEAATAAFAVGYESPSQFSREYRRFFGASPLQDAASLKHLALVP